MNSLTVSSRHIKAYRARPTNNSPDDPFAFSEILRTTKQVGDRDYKKIYIKVHEVISPVPQKKMRRLDFDGLPTSAAFSGSKSEPKQLPYKVLAPVQCHFNRTNYKSMFYSSQERQRKESIRSEGRRTK